MLQDYRVGRVSEWIEVVSRFDTVKDNISAGEYLLVG